MKSKMLVWIAATFVIVACNSVPENQFGEPYPKIVGCENNAWLNSMIELFEEPITQKAEIIEYQYNGQTVYYVNGCLECYDWIQTVYDCMGNELCQFGGIGGLNTCPDFFQKATDKKIIWQN